jgi:hypothetical protein
MTFKQTRGFDAVFRCIVRHIENHGSIALRGMSREARVRDCAKLLDTMTGYTPEERRDAILAARHDGYLTAEEMERLGLQEQSR